MDASPTRAEVAAGGNRKRDTSRRRPQHLNFFVYEATNLSEPIPVETNKDIPK
jgi:hypothetical protein